MKKLILFDLDDTLIASSEFYLQALKSTDIYEKSAFQKARQQIKNRLQQDTSVHNRLLYFKQLLENQQQFSARFCLEQIHKYEQKLEQLIQDQWQNLNRSRLMQTLKKRGYQLRIITNENLRTQIVKLRAMDPEGKYFEQMITSEEIGVEKPDQAIFLQALKDYNRQEDEIVLIGDDLEKDIAPAQALGFKTFLSCEFKTQPETTTECLEDLDLLLERLPS